LPDPGVRSLLAILGSLPRKMHNNRSVGLPG
jgi:hypothetical protein